MNSYVYKLAAPIMLSALITACGGDKEGGPDDWSTSTPEDKGLDSAKLEYAATAMEAIKTRKCFTVIKDGDLVFDTNYNDRNPNAMYDAFSVTKTMMATLIGIAETQGYLSVDDRIDQWLVKLPAKMNPDATIRHVLGQVAESDPVGTKFSYDSDTVIDTLGLVLTAATGSPSEDFAQTQLIEPLNMQYTTWETDKDGNLQAGFGVKSSCRDLARVGQLLLDGGTWRGQQILSPDYIHHMTQPAYPEANSNYGFLTWLNWSEGTWYLPTGSGEGPMLKGAPENLYTATGLFGQIIMVVPDKDVVITTMGTTVELNTMNAVQETWDAATLFLQ